MQAQELYEYRVILSHDEETGHVVAEVPALGIADFGDNAEQALQSIQEMIAFHIECLIEDGKPVPEETSSEAGHRP